MKLEDKEKKTEQKQENQGQYDRLLKTRSLFLCGEINKDSADKLIKDLVVLESESDEPVRIFINSPGGDVDAGFAIYDMVRFVSYPVIMVGMGLVASAAALVLLAVPSDRRVGLPNSSYLIHQPLSEMRGNATEIEIHAQQLEKMKDKLNRIISDATGVSLDKVTLDTDRDHWLDAGEALSYGLISKVIASRSEL